jgi:hypothetical protein
MNLKTAICDDDRNDAEILKSILLRYSFSQEVKTMINKKKCEGRTT